MDEINKILDDAKNRFGDIAFHSSIFDSMEEALNFAFSLSFVTGTSDKIDFPDNMQIYITKFSNGVLLAISGRLTKDQNYEIVKLGKSKKREMTHTAVAHEGSFAYQAFMEASLLIKEEWENKKNDSCFIATECYDSNSCSELQIFRKFRDEKLMTSKPGRNFVKYYYQVSPIFVNYLHKKPRLKKLIRKYFLDQLYRIIR